MTDRPEEEAAVLAGIDGPRPLPDALRQRLEDRLLVDEARPLDPAMAGRLSDTLIGAGSRPGRLRRGPRLVAAAVAAGLLVAGGVGVAVGQSGGSAHPSASRAAGPSAGASASVSGPAGPPAAGPLAAPGSPTRNQQGPAAARSPEFNAGLSPAPAPASGTSSSSASSSAAGAGTARYAPEAAPVVASLSPDRGPAGGGTWVTITGQWLSGVTSVRFGAVAAARLVVVSAGQVRALTPPGPAGPVRVTLSGPAGTATAAFTYLPG